MATRLGALVRGRTVTELGAGLGCYAVFLAQCGAAVVAAVDGATGVEALTGGRVAHWDLTTPMEARADWLLSLEVAEHIPREFEAAFVDNVARNALCGAVLSWAVPGQGGSGHVNERPDDYVRALMASRGLVRHERLSEGLRNASLVRFFKRNVNVYHRPDAPACEPPSFQPGGDCGPLGNGSAPVRAHVAVARAARARAKRRERERESEATMGEWPRQAQETAHAEPTADISSHQDPPGPGTLR